MYEQRLGRYPAGEENGQRHFPQLLQPLQINLLPQTLQEGMIRELCREYLSVNLVICWGIFLQTYGQRLLQAVGDTVLSMVSLIIGAVVNIILDPIMIFGLLGCPAMGIRGAAIATVIGQLIGAAAALWFNWVKNPVIHVRLKGYQFLWQDVADIYRVGLPTIVMQAIGSVMTFAVNSILLGVSSTAVVGETTTITTTAVAAEETAADAAA